MEVNLKIGPYTLYRRTEYSKIQIFDNNGNDILNTNIGKKILEDYNDQLHKNDYYFAVSNDVLNHYEKNNKIKNVFIPDTIKVISASAFENNKFSYIHLPNKLKYIEKKAFILCENLKEISFPETFNGDLDYDVFSCCTGLEKIDLPYDMIKITSGTFNECHSLDKINLPESLILIEDRAFRKCISLKNLILPDTICEIGDCAFQYCTNLERINIPRDIEKLGDNIFAYSGIKELIFNYDLPKRRPVYYGNCFAYNTQINKIVINNTVKFIDPAIFSEIYNKIQTIEYLGTEEEFKAFSKDNRKCLKLLKRATVNITNKNLDNVIKNNKINYIDKIKNIFIER